MSDTAQPDQDNLQREPVDAPGPALSAKHQRFIDEYLKDPSHNAAAAAQRAGYSPRSAGNLLAQEHIRLEIARRQQAVAQNAGVTLEGLIKEAEAAREVAENAGNASAMVAATQLKARLTSQLDTPADGHKRSDEPVDKHQLTLAVYSIFQEALGAGWRILVSPPGETILRVRDPDKLPEVLKVLGNADEVTTTLEAAIKAKSDAADKPVPP
jgi:phage terminase small subunit